MDLAPIDIQNNVGKTFYNRGLAYFHRDHVVSIDIDYEDAERVDLYTVVNGSGHRSYEQDISIHRNGRKVTIDGDCTCPVGYNCKHVVAACLYYRKQPAGSLFTLRKPGRDECLTWLDQFEQLQATNAPQPPKNDFLIYILKPHGRGRASVDFHVTRLLKKGGLGKGRRVASNLLFNSYYHPDYVQDDDIRISQLLQSSNERYSSTLFIRGEPGAIALDKMVKTGRCFWRDFDRHPLQPGEKRELVISWRHYNDGSAGLDITVSPAALPLLAEPPLYVDEQNGEIGPLTGVDCTEAQLESLFAAPRVPAKSIPEFSRRVAAMTRTSLLPPPRSVDVEQITGAQPTPCLMLSAREGDAGTFHLMRLRFMYGAHQIPVLSEADVVCLSCEERLVKVVRQPDEEVRYVDQLIALGFEGVREHDSDDLFFVSYAATLIESANRWHAFLTETVPQLEQQGWHIEFDDNFRMQFHQAQQWDIEIREDGSDWFNLRFDIEVNGQRFPLLPLITSVLEQYEPDQLPDALTLMLGEGDYLYIPAEQVRPVIETLYELYDRRSVSDQGALRMSRFDTGRLASLERDSRMPLNWSGGDELRQLGAQLSDFNGIEAVQPPKGLCAELRPYQQQGLNWLQFLKQYRLGGILADDMGLGKTVQTLAHLLLEKEQKQLNKPCLIIAPTSLMGNWRREAEHFAPALKVLVLHGPERHHNFDKITDHDLVLSTYPLLVRDSEHLLSREFHSLILDEAQTVKNPKSKAAGVIRRINSSHRLCLTGTPMENHLGELWALFDFLMPGFLGDMRQFNSLFRIPVEKHHDQISRRRLAERIAPFMLRRTKGEVVHELPEKMEIVRTVVFDKKQAVLYESVRIAMEEKVRKSIADKGLARSHITILDALLKLRQVCCDPRLLSLKQAKGVQQSAKLELLMQMLPEMMEEGRRVLIFSQFTTMLGIIEAELKKHQIAYTKLTGQTRNRDAVIERFRRGEVSLFLISLKAGGVGLNLTEADTVIHYDPWWNPAAENQATDRAHRIGQQKAVFVYKLVVENSVEEKIIDMQQKKQALAQGMYQQNRDAEALNVTGTDLQQLLAPL